MKSLYTILLGVFALVSCRCDPREVPLDEVRTCLSGMGHIVPSVPDSWGATWIGAPWDGETYRADTLFPAPEFRKEFVLKGRVKRATAHVSGLGFFELHVNGEKVGDDVLVPNETSYGHRPSLPDRRDGIPLDDSNWRGFRVFYLDYDITALLKQGENTLGAVLGNGFYASGRRRWVAPYGTPRLLCRIELEYAGGRRETINTDTTWQVRQSPIVMNDLYEGEIYDARLENAGEWVPAVERKAPDGRLCLQDGPPDKVMEILEPVSVEHGPDGRWVVDFGDYITGWVRLMDFDAPEGRVITIEHPVEGDDYNGVYKYVCAGGHVDSYAPRFTWWSFRKVVIWGWPGELTAGNIRAEAVHSDVRENARFDCSNPLLVRINDIWKRTQKDNMHLGVATDCPHREKGPYTGDGQVACVTVMHNFDADRFYRKWLRDMSDCQDMLTGYVPNGAPWHPGCGGGVPWGAAMTLMPWEHYLHYGDISVLEEHYDAMALQLGHMEGWRTEDGVMYQQMPSRENSFYWNNLGEWCPAYNLPSDALVHTYFLWKCARYMALAAGALGKEADEARYAALADDVREAFHKVFYNPSAGSYGDNDGANFFALHMGVPEEHLEAVLNAVKREFEADGGHLNTGIFGTQLFFDVLCDYGLGEMAYTAMTKTDYPGYGNWVSRGADTFWEQWNGEASRNHPMFGGGLSWMYTRLAGLQADPLEPGYKHMIVKPLPLGDLKWVSYETETPQGTASVRWEKTDGKFSLFVTVPKGSHASVWMPGSDAPVELKAGEHRLDKDLPSMLARWAGKQVLSSQAVEGGACQLTEGIATLSSAEDAEKGRVLRYHTSLVDRGTIEANRTPWGSFKADQGGENCVALVFDTPQDWREFNRVAVWVKIHRSRNPNVNLALSLVNEGTRDDALTPGRETYLDLPQGEWTQVLWEIDYYPRERISRLEVRQTLIGFDREIGEEEVTVDIGPVELQRVHPDHYEGWNLPAGTIAFSHVGYRPQDRKVAIAAAGHANSFSVLDKGGKKVYRGKVRRLSNRGNEFSLLDFSGFRRKGDFRIRYGDAVSESFPIGEDVWKEPLEAALNFYFNQRCGYPVPGVHALCHQDSEGFYGDVRKGISGGWHDAGDLCQGWWRTAYACLALLDALETVEDGALRNRIREEALWGLDWLLKVRFTDGYHISWAHQRIYSDNIPGTPDDAVAKAEYVPWELFQGCAVFLKAAGLIPEREKQLLDASLEDWEAAMRSAREDYLTLSWGAVASSALFDRFGDPRYRDAALLFGEKLLSCQEQALTDSLPVRGFFYADTGRRKILHDHHAAFNEAPMLALAALCRTFPDRAEPWRHAAGLYSDYLKEGSRLSAPYCLLPAGIFRESDHADSLEHVQYMDGTPLSAGYAMRTFPIWKDHIYHGSTNFHLSAAWALAEASALLGDREGMDLVRQQLEWTFGRNPFGSSLMYGVGYDYAPVFAYCTHGVTGALPAGIDSFRGDAPFWNGTAGATSHEIWVEPVSRFIGTLSCYLDNPF